MTDPRLKECVATLASVQRAWDYARAPAGVVLDRRTFKDCVSANICLLSLVFHNDFLVRALSQRPLQQSTTCTFAHFTSRPPPHLSQPSLNTCTICASLCFSTTSRCPSSGSSRTTWSACTTTAKITAPAPYATNARVARESNYLSGDQCNVRIITLCSHIIRVTNCTVFVTRSPEIYECECAHTGVYELSVVHVVFKAFLRSACAFFYHQASPAIHC